MDIGNTYSNFANVQYTNFKNSAGVVLEGTTGYDPLNVKSAGTTALYVKNGGNVGIGTTAPNALLRLNSAADAKLNLTGSNNPRILFTPTSSNQYYLDIVGGPRIYNATASRTEMQFDGSGNVGIGTTSPTVALDVNGRIKSTNTRSMVTGGSLNTTSTSYVDYTGLTLTVTTGNQPLLISVSLGGCWSNTASAIGYYQLLEDGSTLASSIQQYVNGAQVQNVTMQWLKTPSAGSHTYKVQWATNAGTLQCGWSGSSNTLMVWE